MSEEEKAELQEANDEIVWWHNRFNAVQRDYEKLQQRIDKAIEYIKNEDIDICTIRNNDIIDTKNELLEILGDKENERRRKSRTRRTI